MDRSSEESLAALNKEAIWGGKKNSSGNIHYWKGAKFHLDMTDNGLPVIAIYTGADVHDWQLAIPIEQITSSRIKYCYTVMDSAYNSCVIEEFIKNQGHVPNHRPQKAQRRREDSSCSCEEGTLQNIFLGGADQLPSQGFVSSQYCQL